MTMRITKGQKIGGIAALDARDLLRKCSFIGREDGLIFHKDQIEDELFKLSCKRKFGTSYRNCYPSIYRGEKAAASRDAAQFIRNMIVEGYAEPDERTHPTDQSNCYRLTRSGDELCRATAAKPVHRKIADEAIKGFMERVRKVNRDDRFLYRVTVVVLYGSYLRGAERPADVDLAIGMERKISDPSEYRKAHQQYLERYHKGKQLPMYGLFVAEHDVKAFLKNRKRTLSIHPLQDLIGMKKDENFSFELLLGDKNTVSRMLANDKSGSIVA